VKLRIVRDYRALAFLSISLQVSSVLILKYAAIICGGLFCWSSFYYYVTVTGFIFLRVIFWNLALSRGNLSAVYAFTALNPVLLLWLSKIVLNERVSFISALGTSIIVLAIFMQHGKEFKI